MGHTNSTPNYALPQFVTTDKPAWLTDINGAFSAIDTGIDVAKDAADNAQNDATQALTDAGNAGTAAAAADTKAQGALASIADEFLTTNIYALGEMVIYNSLLYVCTSPVVTPGPWTGATNWTRITIEDNLDTINSTLANKADASDIPTIQNVSFGINPALRGTVTAKRYGKVVQICGSFISDNNDIATGTNLFWSLPRPAAGSFYFGVTSYDKAQTLIVDDNGVDATIHPVDYALRHGNWFAINCVYITL